MNLFSTLSSPIWLLTTAVCLSGLAFLFIEPLACLAFQAFIFRLGWLIIDEIFTLPDGLPKKPLPHTIDTSVAKYRFLEGTTWLFLTKKPILSWRRFSPYRLRGILIITGDNVQLRGRVNIAPSLLLISFAIYSLLSSIGFILNNQLLTGMINLALSLIFGWLLVLGNLLEIRLGTLLIEDFSSIIHLESV